MLYKLTSSERGTEAMNRGSLSLKKKKYYDWWTCRLSHYPEKKWNDIFEAGLSSAVAVATITSYSTAITSSFGLDAIKMKLAP